MRELNIGEKIKQRRHELKMSADTLAELIGKDRATLYRYEKSEIKKIPINIVESIAKALNMSINDLAGDGIAVGIGDDNEGEAWTPAEDEQEIDFDLSYQRFKGLIRERKQHMDRLVEINTELLMYRDVCDCILIDLKDGGLNV